MVRLCSSSLYQPPDDGILLSKAPPARRRPTFVIKDVRLFLNTITRSLDIMRSAGGKGFLPEVQVSALKIFYQGEQGGGLAVCMDGQARDGVYFQVSPRILYNLWLRILPFSPKYSNPPDWPDGASVLACVTAQFFRCPVIFAKKSQTKNIAGAVYTTKVESFTHGRVYDVIGSKKSFFSKIFQPAGLA